MKILDCTLRDGGYYTDWNFDVGKVYRMIDALGQAGVSIIELGYKSPPGDKGPFFYCDEYTDTFSVSSVYIDNPAEFAFMVDIKDFLSPAIYERESGISTYNHEISSDLNKIIRPAEDSIFSWVRLATHYATVGAMPHFVRYFKNLGYKVSFNLMGGALLREWELSNALRIAKDSNPNVFCFADSFGTMMPVQTEYFAEFMQRRLTGVEIGFHFHNNMRSAHLCALRCAEIAKAHPGLIVDSSIMGMGRGAGNAMTEFLLRYQSSLTEVIDDFIYPLWEKHRWGPNVAYLYSALNDIHPLYCQRILEHDCSMARALRLLELIPYDKRMKFDSRVLEQMQKEEK